MDNCRNSSPYIRHFISNKYWQQGVTYIFIAVCITLLLTFAVETNLAKWANTVVISAAMLGSISIYICVKCVSPWWRHQMETFSALLAICAGNSPVPGEFHTQRPVMRIFDVFFDLRPNNDWANNGEAGDLRRRRTYYDVSLMLSLNSPVIMRT